MSIHSYLGTTVFETFQTLDYGDRIWPDVELENWQKLENKILAMNLENYLIYRGTFTVPATYNLSGNTVITLNPNGGDSSFEGCINGNYYNISKLGSTTITWSIPITGDGFYYLYLKEIEGQIDPTDALSLDAEYVSTIDPLVPPYTGSQLKTRIIMGILTISGGNLSLNENPTGQLTSNNFLAHINDSSDPHGTTLVQSNLEAGALKISGFTTYAEHIYDLTINATTATEFSLDTILNLAYPEVAAITFISASPLTSCPIPLWFDYGDFYDNLNYFTVHNDNGTPVTAKLLLKFVVT